VSRPALVLAAALVAAAACGEPPAGAPAGAEGAAGSAPEKSDPGYAALLSSLPEAVEVFMDAGRAEDLVRLSIACVDREYPNKPSNVIASDEGALPPRKLHPAFHGCFDWHSAVHGHWAMVRVLKLMTDIAPAGEIREILERHISEEALAGEVAYFREEHHALYERPYGWGWLLRLRAELATWDDPDARRWAARLEPLAALLSERAREYLEKLSVPVRAGTHASTAYALCHMHDYALAVGDEALREAIERRGRDLFLGDERCPAGYEPSGEDFLSPCLAEADLMRRLLPRDDLAGWLDRFLPPLDSPDFAPLRAPVVAKDPEDPRIGHLIGLSFHRAACFRGIAGALPEGDPRGPVFERLAAIHSESGLAQTASSGYGGEHWLASFAIYLLTDAGPYG